MTGYAYTPLPKRELSEAAKGFAALWEKAILYGGRSPGRALCSPGFFDTLNRALDREYRRDPARRGWWTLRQIEARLNGKELPA